MILECGVDGDGFMFLAAHWASKRRSNGSRVDGSGFTLCRTWTSLIEINAMP
jgi:hypothetical protein